MNNVQDNRENATDQGESELEQLLGGGDAEDGGSGDTSGLLKDLEECLEEDGLAGGPNGDDTKAEDLGA